MSERDPLQEECLSTTHVYAGRVLQVHRDRVQLPNGQEGVREWVDHPGATLIVAELADGALLMVRQYRYPIRRGSLEFPAGCLEPGEEPLHCAQRELEEETGYRAAQWTSLGCIHLCVGYSNERIALFLARDLQEVGMHPDADEFLECQRLSLEAVQQAARTGQLTDAKTLSALYLALPHLGAASHPYIQAPR